MGTHGGFRWELMKGSDGNSWRVQVGTHEGFRWELMKGSGGNS